MRKKAKRHLRITYYALRFTFHVSRFTFYMNQFLSLLLLFALCVVWPTFAEVPTPDVETARYIDQLGDADSTVQQTAALALANLPDVNVPPILEALRGETLYIWEKPEGERQIVIAPEKTDVNGQVALNPDSVGEVYPLFQAYGNQRLKSADGADVYAPAEELKPIKADRRLRKLIKDLLELFNPDVQVRKSAALSLGRSGNPETISHLKRALAAEGNRWTKYTIEEAIYLLQLSDPDALRRKEAIVRLGKIHSSNSLPVLKGMLSPEGGTPGEQDAAVKSAIENSITRIKNWEFLTQVIGTCWNGLSLSSILVIIALGLSITFGLMKVINMAHGELMLIGAYTAYLIQNLFRQHLPAPLFDTYFLFAIPCSFVIAGLLGMLIEFGVIRFLYGRPLETLLATWGISLILQQAVRHLFGAANVEVMSPGWLNGGVQVMVGLVFPYNRLFILGFSIICVVGLYLVLLRSSAGLKIRAVTQNREMSACMGISTRRVDRWAFVFGSGLAGTAGCALSQLGNVGPDLGQTYIVDAFMVVVLGGVGKLAGAMAGGIAIGGGNKILETLTNSPVMGKVLILACLILFLQRSPSGIFPAKGRQQED
ncbi:urea ABC transporter permease subunit UrtB [Candidatus Poribacteria bacterium]|nr:urea ABC transporter permease subunit UrtB [Candidatus Poribacteria bacterium]